MKEKIKYILIFLSYFFYSILINGILTFFKLDFNNSSALIKNIYLFLVDIIYLVLLFLFVKKDILDEFKKFKKTKGNLILKYFPIYVIGIILMGLSNAILINITGIELSSNEEAVRSMIKVYPFYMFFSSVIYAPFVEELIFRKSIRKTIKENVLFVIVSGTLFGLIHVVSSGDVSVNQTLMGIPYIIMGIDFAYIYYKSENIFTTMSLHAIHNLILIIIQYMGG